MNYILKMSTKHLYNNYRSLYIIGVVESRYKMRSNRNNVDVIRLLISA